MRKTRKVIKDNYKILSHHTLSNSTDVTKAIEEYDAACKTYVDKLMSCSNLYVPCAAGTFAYPMFTLDNELILFTSKKASEEYVLVKTMNLDEENKEWLVTCLYTFGLKGVVVNPKKNIDAFPTVFIPRKYFLSETDSDEYLCDNFRISIKRALTYYLGFSSLVGESANKNEKREVNRLYNNLIVNIANGTFIVPAVETEKDKYHNIYFNHNGDKIYPIFTDYYEGKKWIPEESSFMKDGQEIKFIEMDFDDLIDSCSGEKFILNPFSTDFVFKGKEILKIIDDMGEDVVDYGDSLNLSILESLDFIQTYSDSTTEKLFGSIDYIDLKELPPFEVYDKIYILVDSDNSEPFVFNDCVYLFTEKEFANDCLNGLESLGYRIGIKELIYNKPYITFILERIISNMDIEGFIITDSPRHVLKLNCNELINCDAFNSSDNIMRYANLFLHLCYQEKAITSRAIVPEIAMASANTFSAWLGNMMALITQADVYIYKNKKTREYFIPDCEEKFGTPVFLSYDAADIYKNLKGVSDDYKIVKIPYHKIHKNDTESVNVSGIIKLELDEENDVLTDIIAESLFEDETF